jgi:hypothetical protein
MITTPRMSRKLITYFLPFISISFQITNRVDIGFD